LTGDILELTVTIVLVAVAIVGMRGRAVHLDIAKSFVLIKGDTRALVLVKIIKQRQAGATRIRLTRIFIGHH
jgi:hypothetical protein